uniref:Uncharacterized protein n=1 Tax=Panagrellus redivivus TaxID=6233 RepID=A0A7E4W927_PANRE
MAAKKPATEQTKPDTNNIQFSFLNQMRELEDEKNKQFLVPDEDYFGARDKAAPVVAVDNPVSHVNTTVAPQEPFSLKDLIVFVFQFLYAIYTAIFGNDNKPKTA